MREIRPYGSEGGGTGTTGPSYPYGNGGPLARLCVVADSEAVAAHDAGGTPALRHADRTARALFTRLGVARRRMPARRQRSGMRLGRLSIASHGYESLDVGCRRDGSDMAVRRLWLC